MHALGVRRLALVVRALRPSSCSRISASGVPSFATKPSLASISLIISRSSDAAAGCRTAIGVRAGFVTRGIAANEQDVALRIAHDRVRAAVNVDDELGLHAMNLTVRCATLDHDLGELTLGRRRDIDRELERDEPELVDEHVADAAPDAVTADGEAASPAGRAAARRLRPAAARAAS